MAYETREIRSKQFLNGKPTGLVIIRTEVKLEGQWVESGPIRYETEG